MTPRPDIEAIRQLHLQLAETLRMDMMGLLDYISRLETVADAARPLLPSAKKAVWHNFSKAMANLDSEPSQGEPEE